MQDVGRQSPEPGGVALVVIDVQQRLVGAMSDFGPAVRCLRRLIRAFQALGRPVMVTEQYPRGLGPTVHSVADLVPGPYHTKTAFSCFGCDTFVAAAEPHADLVLAGIEAHVCVLQTALAALARGHHVFVAADAVASRTRPNRDLALTQLRTAGAAVESTETILFQLLQSSGHAAFRDVSRLVK